MYDDFNALGSYSSYIFVFCFVYIIYGIKLYYQNTTSPPSIFFRAQVDVTFDKVYKKKGKKRQRTKIKASKKKQKRMENMDKISN